MRDLLERWPDVRFNIDCKADTALEPLAALIAAEKLLPWHRAVTYGTAVILVLLGVLLIVAPNAIPGLTVPGTAPMM